MAGLLHTYIWWLRLHCWKHWGLDSFCHLKLWRAFCPWKFPWYCCFWCIVLQLMLDMELVNSRYPRLPSTGLSMRFTRMHLSKWNLSFLAPRWHWWFFFSFHVHSMCVVLWVALMVLWYEILSSVESHGTWNKEVYICWLYEVLDWLFEKW